MLSPASTLEILGGKSLLSLIATMIIVVIGAYLTGYQPENIVVIAIAILFSSFFFIGLGTLLGLLAKSVMEASVIFMPFMFIFGFGSMFTMFADKYPILKVMDYTPNMQLMDIAVKVESGVGFGGVWSNLGIIALWIIGIFVLNHCVQEKKNGLILFNLQRRRLTGVAQAIRLIVIFCQAYRGRHPQVPQRI